MKDLTLKDSILVFFILLFSFAIFGLQPFNGNNLVYIPFMENLKDDSLFLNDPLIKTAEFHPSLYFSLIVKLANVLNLSIKQVLTFLPFIVFFFQALAVFLISYKLFDNKKISYLSLILLMAPKYNLGFEPTGINLHQITPTTLSLPLGLLALYFYLINNNIISFLLLGIIANLQPIISCQLFLLFSFSLLINTFFKKQSRPFFLKDIFKSYLICFLAALPIIFLLLNSFSDFNQWSITSASWLKIVTIRTGHHFLANKWPLINWLLFLFFLIFFYISLKEKKKKKLTNYDKKAVCFALSFIPLFIFTFIFSQIWPIRLVMLLSLFRSFAFFNFLALLYFSFYIFKLYSKKERFYKIISFFLISVLFLPTSIFYQFSILKPALIGVVFMFFISSMVVLIGYKWKQALVDRLIGFIFLIFLLMAAGQRLYRNYLNWGMITFDNSDDQKEWQDIQLWANKNSFKDDVFLTPPNLSGFRLYSQRAVVGEYKDGANFIYHPYLLSDWWQAMGDLGVDEKMGQGAFLFGYKETDSEEVIINLAEKYKADYLVSGFSSLNLNKVYNNSQYNLYKLK